MKFILIFLVLIITFYAGGHRADLLDSTQRNLEVEAARIQKAEAEIRAKKEFDDLVATEAARLKVGKEKHEVIGTIIKTFGQDYKTALAVAKAESGLRCEAYHFNEDKVKSVDHSVFQINDVHKKRGNLNDCAENIKIAKQIVDEQGWNPWVTYWKGTYKNYL